LQAFQIILEIYTYLKHQYNTDVFNVIIVLIAYMCYAPLVKEARSCTPKRGVRKKERNMSTPKPPSIEERLEQIEVAVDQKPERGDVGYWASDLEFKLEEIHDDVRELQRDLAYVTSQVDDLQSEDR
jgi:hypothetical protein